MKPKQEKLTYRECAKGLKQLLKFRYGHRKEIKMAIAEIEKLARQEELKATVKPCFLKPR